uniref:Uncharacterized protein n=1 Tax=Solanum tuberosum TaxID=4113 RepID=M1DFX6_SOLTU
MVKTSRRTTKCLFSSPNVPVCQPWEKKLSQQQKWAVDESLIGSATTHWIAQNYKTWDAENQCNLAMEEMKSVGKWVVWQAKVQFATHRTGRRAPTWTALGATKLEGELCKSRRAACSISDSLNRYFSWDAENQCNLAMEESKGRIAELLGELDLSRPMDF